MIVIELQVGHVITISLAVLGYLVVSLIAWGKMTSDVSNMKRMQREMPTKSDLSAAIATMKADMLTLLDERRKATRRSVDRE